MTNDECQLATDCLDILTIPMQPETILLVICWLLFVGFWLFPNAPCPMPHAQFPLDSSFPFTPNTQLLDNGGIVMQSK